MKKSEILTLLFLSHQDLNHLETLTDYVEQFETIEKQFAGILSDRESKSSSDLQQ